MAGEKILENSESVAPGLKSEPITELNDKEMVSKREDKISDLITSISSMGGTAADVKDGADKGILSKPGAPYPPTSYDHYYAGYNGTHSNDQGYYNAGVQSDNGSYLYYLPGYNPYTGAFMGSDGKQQPYTSSGYLQQPNASWSSTYGGANTKTRNYKSTVSSNGSVKANNGYNSSRTNNGFSNKNSPLLNSGTHYSNSSSNFSKYPLPSQLIKQSNKFGHMNTFNQGFMHYGPMNYQTNGRVWNSNFKSNSRQNFGRNGVADASTELTRGPRASNGKINTPKPSGDKELSTGTIQQNKYNKEDFETKYDNAKFYVIKSFSEDDIHKCVKYDVWSSTPNGNKKLDNAFRDSEGKGPVFLFFSVNGSGQFLGVAEMIGQVDFNKKLDFWQLDKWSGFFPVKWHIVKDVPNNRLKHIILENNDNRAVTYSRDTQEIGLKEGLEMLDIFKSYTEKSSLLDDFEFYEDRERSFMSKRNSASTEGILKSNDSDAASSLISLTKNLSLNPPQPLESI